MGETLRYLQDEVNPFYSSFKKIFVDNLQESS